MKVIKTKIMQR